MKSRTRNRPEDVIAQECVVVRLRMLNRVITNIYDEALRPLKLRASQLNILVATARLGVTRPAEICDRLQLDASTLSRNVERMKTNGWLEVVPDDDGRAQPFQLTAQGRKLLERAMPKWELAQERVKELLGEEAFATIDEAAQRVRIKKSTGA